MSVRVYNPLQDDYIKIQRPITKIVSLDPASTEIIFLLGLGEKVKATDAFSYRPEDARRTLKIGSYTHVNVDILKQINPDIIFTTAGAQKELTRKLIGLGFNVYPLPVPTNIASILNNVLLIGNVLGVYEKARELYYSLYNVIDGLRARCYKKKIKVYIELDLGGPITVGFPTHISDGISLLGSTNIFDDISEAYFTPKDEEILKRDPDIIIYEPKRLTDYEKERFYSILRKRDLFQLLNKRLIFTKGDYLAHMGPSFITDVLIWLKSVLFSQP
ncbi:ABC transporter substrate-binding protein [Saccharolobus solfataricus]|uniref:Iron (III) ABC transporter, periplasmic-binding protein, putative n=3 Tax=Saccharolobus solfataricus TaxID=2287 RepID=Q980Z0_SACS2|nr:ABC transporter substrate-binding protein [Saccharolobus solfataricus]AAK40482.1 Iron (III) ABC transporter, periplasmic-binding protein, putative [Saccharolobus solfataricus P2]AKA73464.1 ABC transporter substrate-binding protein [Saccharolobus solfataricus]AKA76162.1 ABC transporter substrate-binding protein [Saccharolobus solfataricus]AKA78854.1 ABC transporter substrate-binding protein [Saccharolobus solfataricus]AZF67931.1 ABC transporter substrate-binding protein [Saccharolobus solfat